METYRAKCRLDGGILECQVSILDLLYFALFQSLLVHWDVVLAEDLMPSCHEVVGSSVLWILRGKGFRPACLLACLPSGPDVEAGGERKVGREMISLTCPRREQQEQDGVTRPTRLDVSI
jgi:hypothetical protein